MSKDNLCCSCKERMVQVLVCEQCLTNSYCSQRCMQQDWPSHVEDCKFLCWQRKNAGKNFCANHGNCLISPLVKENQVLLKKCAACLETSYCSKKCQVQDWPYHSVICSNKYEHRPSARHHTEPVDPRWTKASTPPHQQKASTPPLQPSPQPLPPPSPIVLETTYDQLNKDLREMTGSETNFAETVTKRLTKTVNNTIVITKGEIQQQITCKDGKNIRIDITTRR